MKFYTSSLKKLTN